MIPRRLAPVLGTLLLACSSSASPSNVGDASVEDASGREADAMGDAAPFVPHAPAGHFPSPSTCPSHADAGGVDPCTQRADCPAGQGCACGDAFPGNVFPKTNACVPASCAADADCGPGGYCSLSVVPGCAATGVTGFFCHTPKDTCDDRTDCNGSACTWTGQWWECVNARCAG